MKKFLVLYESSMSASEQMRNSTPEQAKAGMDAWMAWAGKAGSAIADMGSPVAASVKLDANAVAGTSGAKIAGYSIMQAESKDALIALLQGHPHFMAPGAAIDVFEFLPMPGM